jgi:uncharacterized 2Fe-2S/4Fe-4S cluster protein (DUF4445 family)
MKITVLTSSNSNQTPDEILVPGFQKPAPRLLDLLLENDVYVNASCGGKGTCHKCRVQVKEGFLPITATDRTAFRENEIANGWRLSCQSTPRANCKILVPEIENLKGKPRLIWSQSVKRDLTFSAALGTEVEVKDPAFVFDLGSTGFVMALVDRAKSSNPIEAIVVEAHLLNRQVRYGADVMSRLKTAQDQTVQPLQDAQMHTIKSCAAALREALLKVPSHAPIWMKALKNTAFGSGNSAIVSFLHAWDVSSLAVNPFQPVTRDTGTTDVALTSDETLQLSTLPLLGGFVGADTVAGLVYIEKFLKPKGTWMLVDIGTNTEIVLSDPEQKLWFGSAPAGPAFEGGNISKGMRAEPGAISVARFSKGESNPWEIETIGNDKPQGICGSGLIDILAEGVTGGAITPDGYLPNGSLEVAPEIELLPDDVREFQLAKSATRTACEILIDRAQCRPDQIFLAGTFAQHLRAISVERVGLLPSGIPTTPIGNSSLLGTVIWSSFSQEERKHYIETMRARENQIELALQDDFQDIFVRNLNFDVDAAGEHK